MAYGELGPTHHSIEDIAWLRAIDNMTIVVPADPVETAAAMRWAAATDGPAFIRVSRMSVPQVYPDDYTFRPGRAVTLRDGGDITLMSDGTVLWRALVAAEQLGTEGIEARVISSNLPPSPRQRLDNIGHLTQLPDIVTRPWERHPEALG